MNNIPVRCTHSGSWQVCILFTYITYQKLVSTSSCLPKYSLKVVIYVLNVLMCLPQTMNECT